MAFRPSRLLPLCLLFTFTAATCYYPDGSPITPDNHPHDVNSTDYQPCNSDTSSFSMCCATNRPVKGDTCLSNGLCHNGYGEYWRESCTDPTWSSPFCLKNICANASDGNKPSSDNQMSLCEEDGSWCCGILSSQDCCASKKKIFLPATIGISSPSSASPPTSTSPSSSSSTSILSQLPTLYALLSSTISSFSSSVTPAGTVETSAPQTTPMATSLLTVMPSTLILSSAGQPSASPAAESISGGSHSSENTTSIRIGIGIGIGSGLFLILLAIIIFLVIKLRRARRKEAQGIQKDVKKDSIYETKAPRLEASSQDVYRWVGNKEDPSALHGFFQKSEMGSTEKLTRSELSSERGIHMMSAEREVHEVQGSTP